MINETDYSDKKIDLNLWKKLFGYAAKQPRLVIAVLASMAVVSIVDVLYPIMTKIAIDRYVTPQTTEGLWKYIVLYSVLIIIQGFCTFKFIERAGKLEMEIAYSIRSDAFTKLEELSFSFYDTNSVGYLMARMISDVSRLSEMLAWSMVDILWSVFYAAGCLVTMFMLNAKLALIVITVIPPLAVISFFLQKRILRLQRDARKQNSKITSAFNEGIAGAMTTKTLVLERRNSDEFSNLTEEMDKLSVRSLRTSALFFPLIISLGAIATALALSLGGLSVLKNGAFFIGAISLGTLVSFISYSTQLFDPIQQIAGVFAELQSAQASAERVMDLIHTVPEVVDDPKIIEKYGDFFNPNRSSWEPVTGAVTFKNVSFKYKNGEAVLDHFDLDVHAGETIALVGETGAGKSTIVNLLCRFYEPTSGVILIDGVDYRERSQLWLQSALGYVLQSPHLFSGTIRDNISFGKPGASIEEVRKAAASVHADRFIESLPDGYDTEVGEGGSRLSVGQKQLISFARVILADPRIFVLDEATSSVDTETEQLIQSAISKVLTGRTSFIVAHRLSTIRNADRILVIRKGQIRESGTHDQLMAKNGYYYDLYRQQFMDETTGQILS